MNWRWVHFRAGRLPRYGFPVAGNLADYLHMPRDEALKIVEEGERQALAAIQAKHERDERLKRELVSLPGLPSSELLRQTVFEKQPIAWIATTADELKDKKRVPDAWKTLIEAQDQKQPLP